MKPEEMDRLIEEHLAAEKAGDTARAVSMYTQDVEHDVVGAPHGPLHGKERHRASTTSSPASSTPRKWSLPTAITAMTSA